METYGTGVYGSGSSSGGSGPSGSGTLNYIAKWTPSGAALGNSQFFDNGTDIGLGTAAPNHYFDIVKTQDEVTTVNVTNASAGTGAIAKFRVFNGSTTVSLEQYGTGYITSGSRFQNGSALWSTGVGGLSIVSSNASGDMRFFVGDATNIKARFLATNGFFGVNVSPTAMGHFVGSGATSGTFAFKAENSSLTNLMSIRNDGLVTWGAGNPGMVFNKTDNNLTIYTYSNAYAAYFYADGNTGTFTAAYSGSQANQYAMAAQITNTGTTIRAIVANRVINAASIYRSDLTVSISSPTASAIVAGAGTGIDFSASTTTAQQPTAYAQMGMVTTDVAIGSYAGYLFWKASTGAALVENMRLYPTGLILATGGSITSPNAASLLEFVSTTQGVRFPNMTTTQRDAISTPPAGLVIYNSTTNKLNVYTTAWEAITSL